MKATYECIINQVGITFFVLFPMSVAGLCLVLFVLFSRIQGEAPSYWALRGLQFIQGCACEIGLLGSVIALSMSFGRLEPSISKEIVSSMLNLLSHAFGSTIFGVVVYLICSAGLFFLEETNGANES
jgi:hypothetical protein